MEQYISIIEELLNQKVNFEKYVSGGNNLTRHALIKACSGAYYLVKIIKKSEKEFDEYLRLQNLKLGVFQPLSGYHRISDDQYLVVMEWCSGKLLNSVEITKENKADIKYIEAAAATLRKLHSSTVDDFSLDIDSSLVEKLFNNCSFLAPENITVLKQYILKNISIINRHKYTVVHGDMHLGNILIDDCKVVLIDTDDVAVGDPYMDLVYAANIHKSGKEKILYYILLKSYFEGNVPEDFWIIVNAYSILKILAIMRFEIESTQNHQAIIDIGAFIEQHNNMENDIPNWYQEMERKFGQE